MNGNILVVTVDAWNDVGILNTMQNLFGSFDSQKIYSLYFRSELPNTKYCNHAFQINELLLYKKLFNPKISVCRVVPTIKLEETKLENEEKKLKNIYHLFNSSLFLLGREFVWSLGMWKEKSLREYVLKANPKTIFVTVSSFIYTNKVIPFLKELCPNAKLVLFFVDDNYTYKAIRSNLFLKIHRFFLRKVIKRNVEIAEKLLAISPKMQEEYSYIFKKQFTLLTKSVKTVTPLKVDYSKNKKLNILYVGNLLYGRYYTLLALAKSLYLINDKSEIQFHLSVYTQTVLSKREKEDLCKYSSLTLNKAVPYRKVKELQNTTDMVVFFESFIKSKYCVARLSFSTKITDYLSSGKPILAIGPYNIAPIEYLSANKAAFIINRVDEIYDKMYWLSHNMKSLNDYTENAVKCCITNHNFEKNLKLLNSIIK